MADFAIGSVSSKSVKAQERDEAKEIYLKEKSEASIWSENVDVTNEQITSLDVNIADIKNVIKGLSTDLAVVASNKEKVGEDYKTLVFLHDALKNKPKYTLTPDEKKYLANFTEKKVALEDQKNQLTVNFEELDKLIEVKKKDAEATEKKQKEIKENLEKTIEPRYKKEDEEAQDAYKVWKKLEKEVEEEERNKK